MPNLRAKQSHIRVSSKERTASREGWHQSIERPGGLGGGDLSGPLNHAGLTEELGIGEALQQGNMFAKALRQGSG